MFDSATIQAAIKIAARLGVPTSVLLAVAEVESNGVAYALVDGQKEPLIRWEGHYFDQRLSGEDRASARALGLASPKAGKIPNPNKQSDRYKLLERAAEINKKAAYESASWGLGQVMGAHWKHLGFKSVDDLVKLARTSAAGQMEVMARFIEKNGLTDELRRRDWAAFARAYNGPGYKRNAYDTKMAKADAKWTKKLASDKVVLLPPVAEDLTKRQVSSVMHRGSKGEFVEDLQRKLNTLGFGPIDPNGSFGPITEAAVKAFQNSVGLTADGWAGPKTLEAIGREIEQKKTAPKIEAAKKVVEEAANGDKNYSSTEIMAGIAGLGGGAGAVKSTIDTINEGTRSALELVTSVGPWVLLGLVVVGAAGYIYYSRRKVRIEATAVREEI